MANEGWRGEAARHSLASRGIKTKSVARRNALAVKGMELSQRERELVIATMEQAATHAWSNEDDPDEIRYRDEELVPFIRELRKKWGVTTPEEYAW